MFIASIEVARGHALKCEACDQRFEGRFSDQHADAWTRARAGGWEIRQVSGQWVHLCPWCASPGND
jgi:hypothetical protein